MKWTLRRGTLLSHVACANNRVTIDGLIRLEIKFSDRCEVTNFFFFFFVRQLPRGIVVALYNTYVRMFLGL